MHSCIGVLFLLWGVYCDICMGGVFLNSEYPFEIDEISPNDAAEADIERVLTELLAILDNE